MELLSELTLAVAVCSLIAIVVGLVKPWPVLWWRHTQNRKGVLALYGPVAACALAGYLLIQKLC